MGSVRLEQLEHPLVGPPRLTREAPDDPAYRLALAHRGERPVLDIAAVRRILPRVPVHVLPLSDEPPDADSRKASLALSFSSDRKRARGRLARDLLLHLLPEDLKAQLRDEIDKEFDFDEERDAFIRYAQRRELGPSTTSLVEAAIARDIPWLRLNEYSLIQFGHGKYQKRIQATITSETRHIAVEIASDKDDTNTLLLDLGLPVPEQELAYSEREALGAAQHIGYPVVVKPLDANHGRGVSINLNNDEEVVRAFGVAQRHSSSQAVLVERFITGFDHRMLVIGGKLVAVAKRVPGHVVGDGVHTVEALVEIVNSDPRRGIGVDGRAQGRHHPGLRPQLASPRSWRSDRLGGQ